MEVTFDERAALRGVIKCREGIAAVRVTFDKAGSGRVVTGRREKDPAIDGLSNPWPSYKLWKFYQRKGKDPFAILPDPRTTMITHKLGKDLESIAKRANETTSPQIRYAQLAVIIATQGYRKLSKDRVVEGLIGTNSTQYARRKKRLVIEGKIPADYGSPPPFLILTGRFVESFAARWMAK